MSIFNKGSLKKKTITLTVKGMSCEHCVTTIKNKLMEEEGVSKVKINLKSGKTKVTYYVESIDRNQIKQIIEELGYKVKE